MADLESNQKFEIDSPDPPKTRSQPLNYIAEIDGLRAVAVSPIILYHFDLGVPGGFVGVDIFFVISGYLITRICLSHLESGEPSWMVEFWIRRVRRLFPALALVLAFTLGAWYSFGNVALLSNAIRDIRFVLLCVANMHFYFASNDYWFSSLESPLIHCWSLSVEEQFYLLYPLLLWVLWDPARGMNRFIGLLVLVIGGSLFSAHYSSRTWSHGAKISLFAFYWLPPRAWELALGGVALYVEKQSIVISSCSSRLTAEVVASCGLASLIAAFSGLCLDEGNPSVTAIMPCVGTALLIVWARKGHSYFGVALANPVFVFIGKMSYALYLWHWPIRVFLTFRSENLQLGNSGKLTGIAMTAIFAAFSSFYVEPLFRSSTKMSHRRFLMFGITVWLLLLMATLFLALVSTIPKGKAGDGEVRKPSIPTGIFCQSNHELINFLSATSSESMCLEDLSDSKLNEAFSLNASNIHVADIAESRQWTQDRYQTSLGSDAVLIGTKGGLPSIVMLGNSHCMMWGESFERLALEYDKTIGVLCLDGASGKFGIDKEWDDRRLSYLKEWQPEMVVLFEWWCKVWQPDELEGFFEIVLGTGVKQVLLFGDPPYLTLQIPTPRLLGFALQRAYERAGDFSFLTHMYEEPGCHERRMASEKHMEEVTLMPAWKNRTQYFPVSQYFINSETSQLMVVDPCQGTFVYKDAGHLNVDGARRVESLFRKTVFRQRVCHLV